MNTTAHARIDLAAIRHNVAALREHARPAQLMAVVKADGYGHGMVPSARAALAGGADWLGVATLGEALALRAAGIGGPILCWLAAPGECYREAVAAEVDVTAGARWLLEEIRAGARQAGRPARVHLKIDTGMSRGGATLADWADLVGAALAAQAAGEIQVVGLFSHLACADIPDHPSVARQVAAFGAAVELADRKGVRPQVRHLANSAAMLADPATHFDLVRPGIAVYGLPPDPGRDRLGLRPAMTLSARLALVKRVPAGTGVSYGHRHVTAGETTLALVPLGYADGVPREATNRGEVLVAGRRRRIAGTVCMDQFVVEVGDDPAAPGDEAVLFGPGDAGEPTAHDWAGALGTITNEIVTRIGPRVPRIYPGMAT